VAPAGTSVAPSSAAVAAASTNGDLRGRLLMDRPPHVVES
jgi:hypothetical protein